MRSFLINLLVAFLWLLLQTEPGIFAFAVGFALGFGLLALFRPVMDSRNYVRRVIAGIVFFGVFARDFWIACWHLVVVTLARRVDDLQPDFFIYDVSGMTRLEILILSHAITLTPGSSTIDISHDFKRLYLHVLDVSDTDAVKRSIDENLRNRILAFTR